MSRSCFAVRYSLSFECTTLLHCQLNHILALYSKNARTHFQTGELPGLFFLESVAQRKRATL
jgi:hypothetical protein